MNEVVTCLWFDGQARAAAEFYTDLFGGEITSGGGHPEGGKGTAGEPMTVEFSILGQRFMGLNGGPQYTFSVATSFLVPCSDQAEIDRYWDALAADGGTPIQCGWITDRFGVTWQIIPAVLPSFFSGDPAKAAAVSAVMMPMAKLDLATLQQASDEA